MSKLKGMRAFWAVFDLQSPPGIAPRTKTYWHFSRFHPSHRSSYPRSRQFESVHRHQTPSRNPAIRKPVSLNHGIASVEYACR
jgi:hypothetical protein